MELLELDESQKQAMEHALGAQATVITGAAGTGKTTVLLNIASALIDRGESFVILASGRLAADAMRSRLTLKHERMPAGVSVRTAQAWAFTILQAYAAENDRHTPELITGAGQDAIISELLTELGDDVPWPASMTEEIRTLPGFRAELRDLLTRAAELGLSGSELVDLGHEHGLDNWVAAGTLMNHYENFLALEDASVPGGAGADRFDHARLVHQAARLMGSPDLWEDMPSWDWILVDDYQNATLATASLLNTVHGTATGHQGSRLVLCADPDTAVEGFRGGIAHLPALAQGTKSGLGMNADLVSLGTRHRGGKKLSTVQDELVARIGVAGTSQHRKPAPASGHDSLLIRTYPGPDQQLAGIARTIRLAHVREGLSYDNVAIVTRARNSHPELERVLLESGVKVRPATRVQPLRYTPIIRALMDVIREAATETLDDGELLNLLSSPIIGLEPNQRRNLSRHVVMWASENETPNPVRALLTDAPDKSWARPMKDLNGILAATRQALDEGLDAEGVLWAAWKATGLAETWRDRALDGGTLGRSANDMLDAVMQMFRTAQRMVDRDARTTALQLIDELDAQDIAEDSIARTGQESGVHLVTPAMSVGLEFDLVIVADLNDDLWPNLRMRDGIFGAGKLADLYLDRLTDGVSGARSVLDDELRMFAFAISRTRKDLILTGVDSEETSHSRFIDLIAGPDEIERVTASQLSMSLSGVVGRLRSALTDPVLGINDKDRNFAARILASLPAWTDRKISGVEPETWAPLIPPSSSEPWAPDNKLSPSALESILNCPLNWFIGSRGLKDVDDRQALDLGILIHDLAEKYPTGGLSEMRADFESRWADFSKDMPDGFEKGKLYDEASTMVSTLATYLAQSPPADVEQTITVETENLTISGRVDRVEHHDAGPIIVDFKTGSAHTKAAAQDNPQLKLYQWAYEQQTGIPTGGARLEFVKSPLKTGLPASRPQDPLGEDGVDLVLDMLSQARQELSGSELAARINDRCNTCAAKIVCPNYDEGALFS